MHPIFQSFKRTYWSSMRFSRAWMYIYNEDYRMTPARFDMMLVIAHQPGGIAQTALRKVLDVCPAVVTVMLDSLEDLEYVVRLPHPTDGRMNWVVLTKLGTEILAEITKELLVDGATEYGVRAVLSRQPADDASTERVLARTRRFVAHLRHRVRDRSTLVYPAYLRNGQRDPAHPYDRADHVFWRRSA